MADSQTPRWTNTEQQRRRDLICEPFHQERRRSVVIRLSETVVAAVTVTYRQKTLARGTFISYKVNLFVTLTNRWKLNHRRENFVSLSFEGGTHWRLRLSQELDSMVVSF